MPLKRIPIMAEKPVIRSKEGHIRHETIQEYSGALWG